MRIDDFIVDDEDSEYVFLVQITGQRLLWHNETHSAAHLDYS